MILHDARRDARALLMRALGVTCYRRLAWMELRLDGPVAAHPADVALETRFLTAAEAGTVAALRPDLGRAEIERRLAGGVRCFGAWHDGRLVACIWIATGLAPIAYLGLTLPLPPGAAYQHDLWTDPRLRGLRIAPALGSAARRALAAERVDLAVAAVLPENRAGLANVRRAGYRHVATVGWVGVGPLRRRFVRYVPRSRR